MSISLTSMASIASPSRSFIPSVSRWDNRTVISLVIGLSIVGILAHAIYSYVQTNRIIGPPSSEGTAPPDLSSTLFVLKRDSGGFYTLPHFEVPGFKHAGTSTAREFKVYAGEFIIDTEKGIVPKGWVLQP